jgi:glycosyltransferase involved in cell wall biosynthesis
VTLTSLLSEPDYSTRSVPLTHALSSELNSVQRVKIAFLASDLNCGGAQRQLITLIKGLRAHGRSVLVITYHPGGALENELRHSGVPLHFVSRKWRWNLVGFLWQMIRLLREERPDILHGYLSVPNICTVFLKPFFPHIRMVWGVRSSNVDLSKYEPLSRLVFWIESRSARFADLVIANSFSGRGYAIAHGFPEHKTVVIHNGIDTAHFQRDPQARRRLRSEWRIADNEKLIGIAGRLDPMKDHKSFLMAASLLAKERTDVRFVCVGDGPPEYQRELIDYCSELGLAKLMLWAGVRHDMPSIYSALDVLTVSSSFGEGFPNVIGEAMACGVPCVATNVGDSAMIIGDLGELVPPEDSHSLKQAIEKLLERTATNPFGFGCIRERITNHFSVDKLLAQTESTLLCLARSVRPL